MEDINNVFSSPCHMHCWLSRTFYRTQISLLDKGIVIFYLRGVVVESGGDHMKIFPSKGGIIRKFF